MLEEQNKNRAWRYFKRDSMTGEVYEIYRCPANGMPVEDQKHGDVYLLLEDGNWRPNMKQVLVNEIMNGQFDDPSDEISEEEANNYYKQWKLGKWPGWIK